MNSGFLLEERINNDFNNSVKKRTSIYKREKESPNTKVQMNNNNNNNSNSNESSKKMSPQLTSFTSIKSNTASSINIKSSKMSLNKNRIIGTPDYIPPEIIKGTDFNNPGGDFWSLGVMVFECLTGIPPFNDDTTDKIFDNVVNLRIPWDGITVGEGEGCMSEVAVDFIKKMLVLDPLKRLSVQEIKKHKFFKGQFFLFIVILV